ncbi:UDP-N-Acetylglucosamine 2-epimerase [Actinokineospora alba]|uniref:UDP-N-acetylglucosamine 2-epimerase (non-hydrolyzing) n=1 Tax=Actinokineospora alba TaxID=504798 RepID=A0A1H0VLA8_9PSEU|nr:UDP-N-acetylglucosamine 2-epimerase (non-hydrolysing) [Actinokineospora alba]SDJ29276.1 UDP-N-acetylglucosamine 2-epimerase (non-hydrolysing) [Actinokineospora alba]SDP79071.1 UDP-N-Acetylglucosamine 2-epimerase [Actinokineospora alba]
MEVLLLVGTRPEAVKAAPVALALGGHAVLRSVIVHSGQHAGMVEQALEPFGLNHTEALDVNRGTGTQAELVAELLPALDELLTRRRPAAVIVQGDTTTTLAGALCAFWHGIPVVHLEAGLRTGDLAAPFPEEGNRQMVARIAALHLAPTEDAAAALRAEAVAERDIVVTGNTVVDAVLHIAAADRPAVDPSLAAVERDLADSGGRLVLVTVHRRESWGAPLDEVLGAVRTMVERHPDIRVVLPTHPNPAVGAQVRAALGGVERVSITGPLDYPDLVRALRLAALVVTDSGGIQEEAPSFGAPVLVARKVTERREAVRAGCAWLVGTDRESLLAGADRILGANLRVPADRNPFGDGAAARRVLTALERLLLPGSAQSADQLDVRVAQRGERGLRGVGGDGGGEAEQHRGLEPVAGRVDRGGPHAVVGRDADDVDLRDSLVPQPLRQ